MNGVEATITCDSNSSNPPAFISLWKEGIPVVGGNVITRSGLWGGTISSLIMNVNVTQDMNGVGYTCQSNHKDLQRIVHETVKLQVLCKYCM